MGKAYMTTMMGSRISTTLEIEGFHWFGDPAMEIRTEKPPLMLATYPPIWQWALRAAEFPVNVEWLDALGRPAAPVEDAWVSISRPGAHQDTWVGKTAEDGGVIFPELLLDDIGTYNLTIRASNFIPVTITFEVTPGPAAGLRFNKRGYVPGEEVIARLADIDMEGQSDIQLQVVAEDGIEIGDSLYFTVTQEMMGSGYFEGSFTIEGGPPNLDDDILQVTDGGWFSTSYFDLNDTAAPSGTVEDIVLVDGTPPDFGGLLGASPGPCSVLLEWDPGADPHGPLVYYIYKSLAPGDLGELIGTSWGSSFPDYTCQLGTPFYYTVRAQDRLGNEDSNEGQLEAIIPGVYLPLVLK